MDKIERLDAKTGNWASLVSIEDSDFPVALSIGNGLVTDDFMDIPDLSTLKVVYHVLGEWIKTKEAEDE